MDLPNGMSREDHVHPYGVESDDEDDMVDCHGCTECADSECPACKGTGRVREGFSSWKCGCTYEVPGTSAYRERIARDVAVVSVCPWRWMGLQRARGAPSAECLFGACAVTVCQTAQSDRLAKGGE